MKPICVPCERFMRPDRNGIWFIEGMPTDSAVEPGLAQPDDWKPYKLWCGDRWACPDCGTKIIVGVGQGPLREHYQPDFDEVVRIMGAELLVKDC